MTILVTAFAPFQQESINATKEAIALLPDCMDGADIRKHILPVVFRQAAEELCALVDEIQPDAVVCLGQASGRADITPERVAINVMDARIPDNGGNQPADQSIRADGPAAYFSTLPIKAMVQAMKAAGVPASVSNTAGTFVCNDLMYGLLGHLEAQRKTTPAGFIHIPATPEQACDRPTPSMSAQTAAKGLEAAISTLIVK